MSVRINQKALKTLAITEATKIVTEDPNENINQTLTLLAPDVPAYVYAASDEDSALTTGLQYTTEAALLQRSIKNIGATLKNAPTGSSITIDIKKETGADTNVFATILSTLITIDINKFMSKTSATQPVISDGTWESNRRMQIIITITDSNAVASGLKVTIAS